ncbi:acetyl-CoA C-acetyltransferase [bacterium]|nr:acetyl-CoA C-acetyltransferase [bacterium]
MATVILDATRTPIGSFCGALKDIHAPLLGAHCIKTLYERNGIDPAAFDEVIMGMVVPAGVGQIPSRQAAIQAGIPVETASFTVNKVCASGMYSISLADLLIQSGKAGLIIAGGMESMSRVPFANFDLRTGKRMMDSTMVDLMVHDGLWCAFDDVHMAAHGEKVAKEYEITREMCDEYAVRSQTLAGQAMEAGRLDDEITPFPIPTRKGDPLMFDKDEQPRPGTTIETLAKLRPVLGTETITAGNAPSVNDAGAALIICSEEKAKELGKEPLAYIRGEAHVAMQPYQFPVAPAYAALKLLQATGVSQSDIKVMEFNEAFAAVALACGKVLDWDLDKVNPNGGAIAYGHPIGMSGARITMTLAYELRRRGGGLGIASICSGSGQGDALLLEVKG